MWTHFCVKGLLPDGMSVCCSESVQRCWTMRGRRFQEIEGINTLEQPETCLESESCSRRSVRQLSLPLFHIKPTITALLFDWSSLIMWLPAAPALRKTRAELMKDVDAEYYGYRDEDDGVLLPLEAQYEKQGQLFSNVETFLSPACCSWGWWERHQFCRFVLIKYRTH